MTFVDSNVFVYALERNATSKQKKARRIVADAFAARAAYRISSQVLAEFSSVALRKLGIGTPLLLSLLVEMGKISHVTIDNALVSRAVGILTEDLSDGQLYCGIMAVNPFKG